MSPIKSFLHVALFRILGTQLYGVAICHDTKTGRWWAEYHGQR